MFATLWFSLFGRSELRAKIGTTKLIWICGIAFPVVVLSLLLFYGLTLTRSLTEPVRGDEMRVRIIALAIYLESRGESRPQLSLSPLPANGSFTPNYVEG